MRSILLALLLAANPDFPDVEGDVVEDVDSTATEEPIVDPADDDAVTPGEGWQEKNVRPKDLNPSASKATHAPPLPSAPAKQAPPPSPVLPPSSPGPAQPAKPLADTRPYIAGYHDSLWGDAKSTVERAYPSDRPMVDRGNGKWLIQDQCEGEAASVTYGFTEKDELNRIVCLYKRGLENASPDHPLYVKIRKSLVKQWGEPSSTNESPAPDSPSQAAEWDGKTGKATLVFSADEGFVQLTVEKK